MRREIRIVTCHSTRSVLPGATEGGKRASSPVVDNPTASTKENIFADRPEAVLHCDSTADSKMFATSPGRSTWQSWPVSSSATSQPEARAFRANGSKNGLAGYPSATPLTKVAGMLAFRLAGRRSGSSKQRRLKSHSLARTKSRASPGFSPQRSSWPSPPGNRQPSPCSRARLRKWAPISGGSKSSTLCPFSGMKASKKTNRST